MNFKKKYAKFPNPKFIQLVKQLFETEPVSLFASLTLAEMNILVAANGLQTGMQYKVTDKDWNLVATSPNTSKPLVGIIKILNGGTLPVWLQTDEFYVSTGELKVSHYNSPLLIQGYAGYYVSKLIFKNNGSANIDDIILRNPADNVELFTGGSPFDVYPGSYAELLLKTGCGGFVGNTPSNTYNLYVFASGTISYYVYLVFKKIPEL
jgi:hypothetical protein